MTKEERSARELADVKDVARKEQSVAEDRREQVRVFPGAHGAEEDHVGIGTQAIGQRDGRHPQRGDRRSGAIDTQRITFEVRGGNARIGRDQTVRHRDDVDSVTRLGRSRKCTRVLQLAPEVETAEKGENIAEWNTLLS